jgi:ribulose-5-phosphate 4-epimerase/fuculose-1-phosphate aldolase
MMKKLEGEMIKWGKLLFDRHLISGWGGNLSCRIRENEFLITGRHAPLGFLTTADLVRIDGAGTPLMETSSHRAKRLCIWPCTQRRGHK